MYKCEHCGSMDLSEKMWGPVNSQSSVSAEILEEPMWCDSCEQHTKGILLPVVKYEYKASNFVFKDGVDLTEVKNALYFCVEATTDGFYFHCSTGLGFEECSDDGHHVRFKRWLDKSKTIFQEVTIWCFPKIWLSEHSSAISEFFEKKPSIDVRVYEIKERVVEDRVVGTMPFRLF